MFRDLLPLDGSALAQCLPDWLVGSFAIPELCGPRPGFRRTEATPYTGRAKFRQRVKPGDGPDCFEDRALTASDLVVQLPAQVWKVAPETAGHVMASQIGNASRRRDGFVKPKWG